MRSAAEPATIAGDIQWSYPGGDPQANEDRKTMSQFSRAGRRRTKGVEKQVEEDAAVAEGSPANSENL